MFTQVETKKSIYFVSWKHMHPDHAIWITQAIGFFGFEIQFITDKTDSMRTRNSHLRLFSDYTPFHYLIDFGVCYSKSSIASDLLSLLMILLPGFRNPNWFVYFENSMFPTIHMLLLSACGHNFGETFANSQILSLNCASTNRNILIIISFFPSIEVKTSTILSCSWNCEIIVATSCASAPNVYTQFSGAHLLSIQSLD